MTYSLQSRWKLKGNQLVYYGLQNKENLFKNKIKISRRQAEIISSLPKELNQKELQLLGKLLNNQIVTTDEIRKIPKSINEARFCKNCSANDFIIPGIEFDENGICPMCQTIDDTKELKSIVPIVREIPRTKKSRFDVALFYTGGKDSTYLLYYLAKVKKYRVLAMTWEIPYMSESARQSIENAKKYFDNVEFITRTVKQEDLRKVYKKLYKISENTCACPSLAYVLFYPEMVANRVPYFMAGNEPAQMLGLYYNSMAPKIAYTFWQNKFLQILINITRILTLHPPLKKGQFHTLAVMKQLAKGDSLIKKLSGYSDELVSNIVTAISEVPQLLKPLKRSIRCSSRTCNIPAFVHLDFDEISGGSYNWRNIKDIIVKECGWVAPEDDGKGLHTSCKIEKCKEYSQFVRFYNCRSRMIPFSAVEISLASRNRNLSREEAISEIENSLGFSLEEIPETEIMCGFLKEQL
ncbi:hypothetical protein [Ruminococcus sp.]|uniref:hypothetical protein n=1 Tax=Ruminococcus sp. TaxID=41978 RepID=UPI00260BD0D4|nr:hypothetical protein [Ruminococcus sp.]MDD6988733.1 hypothetical protein [Ruminococcus sp.]MDY6201483.1 hypothetical protein [Ruminococcus sp.]